MAVSKKDIYPAPLGIIFTLWVVGLLVFPIVAFFNFRGIDLATMLILISISLIAPFFISFFAPSTKNNRKKLLIPAAILIGINLLAVLDYWAEVSFEATCGTGFGAGNCFFMEGLGIVLYYLLIPVLLIASNILLTINLVPKHR